ARRLRPEAVELGERLRLREDAHDIVLGRIRRLRVKPGEDGFFRSDGTAAASAQHEAGACRTGWSGRAGFAGRAFDSGCTRFAFFAFFAFGSSRACRTRRHDRRSQSPARGPGGIAAIRPANRGVDPVGSREQNRGAARARAGRRRDVARDRSRYLVLHDREDERPARSRRRRDRQPADLLSRGERVLVGRARRAEGRLRVHAQVLAIRGWTRAGLRVAGADVAAVAVTRSQELRRAGSTGRSGGAGCSRHTLGPGLACHALRAGRAFCALRAVLAFLALRAGRPVRALGAGFAFSALRALRAGCAFVALWALRSGFAFCALRALRAGFAFVALGALRAGFAFVALRALRSGRAGYALRSGFAFVALGALRSGFAFVALRALRAGFAFVAPRALPSVSAFSALRAALAS